jgi:hypothetical protein
MISMKRIVLLWLSVVLSFIASGQNKCDKDTDVFVDIDGIELYTSPTQEELETHFGTAMYAIHKVGNGDLGPYDYYYYKFEGLELYVDTECGLKKFVLTSGKYPVMTLYGVGDGIRVGDKWDKSKISQMPVYDIEEMAGYHEGEVWYNVTMWYKSYTFDHVTSFIVKEGIVIEIYSWPYEA